MAVNYVKFYRGSSLAFKDAVKNPDTLYFITDSDSDKGALYLGDKIIASNADELSDLKDLLISNLDNDQILVYNGDTQKWVNKAIDDVIGLMAGATQTAQGGSGLVPAPGIGQQSLFLRGDGTWAMPEMGENQKISSDEKTLEFLEDGITLSLKDFGKKFYKYIPATGSLETGDFVEAHYEVQVVDGNHAWKEGLEPKVVNQNGQFVLGWFEKDSSIIERVDKLTKEIKKVNDLAEENKSAIGVINNSINNITDLLNKKANINDVYTKAEVDEKIVNAAHLTRKTFNSIEEAYTFANSVEHPENYIYMVASTGDYLLEDKYVEYLYVDGVLEFVGSWDVNLDDYATKEEVANQISTLEALLNNKADQTEVSNLSNNFEKLSTKVDNIEQFMNSDYFNTIEEVKTEINEVKECVTWGDL